MPPVNNAATDGLREVCGRPRLSPICLPSNLKLRQVSEVSRAHGKSHFPLCLSSSPWGSLVGVWLGVIACDCCEILGSFPPTRCRSSAPGAVRPCPRTRLVQRLAFFIRCGSACSPQARSIPMSPIVVWAGLRCWAGDSPNSASRCKRRLRGRCTPNRRGLSSP